MAGSFNRKATAKAFFGLDISETEPSSTVTKGRPGNGKKTKAPIKPNQKCVLLELPAEIRLEIYDLLLVSRFKRWDGQSTSSIGDGNQRFIMLDMGQCPECRTMEPALLQTCKQIYLEALPIFYSRNVFYFNDPMLMFRHIAQIGDMNMKLIRSLVIYIPRNTDKGSWLDLFQLLPEATTGLKNIKVHWWGESVERPPEKSLGKDIDLTQALAGLSKLGLDKLRIGGYYAKPWPVYFRDKLGAGIVEHQETHIQLLKDDEDAWMHPYDREVLEDFRKYQDGTKSLNPWEEHAVWQPPKARA